MKTKLIAVLIAMVVLAGVASGALVNYLSNEVTADITVSSPIEQSISDDYSSGYGTSLTISDTFAGETEIFYVKTKNLANAQINGIGKNIVTSSGITCADFTSVKAKTSTNGATWTPLYDITSTCAAVSGYPNQKRQFSYGPIPHTTWAPGQEDITEIQVTFKYNVVGTYVFTSEIVPAV